MKLPFSRPFKQYPSTICAGMEKVCSTFRVYRKVELLLLLLGLFFCLMSSCGCGTASCLAPEPGWHCKAVSCWPWICLPSGGQVCTYTSCNKRVARVYDGFELKNDRNRHHIIIYLAETVLYWQKNSPYRVC